MELARKPLGMTEADACAVLGVSPGADGQVCAAGLMFIDFQSLNIDLVVSIGN